MTDAALLIATTATLVAVTCLVTLRLMDAWLDRRLRIDLGADWAAETPIYWSVVLDMPGAAEALRTTADASLRATRDSAATGAGEA